MSSAQLDEITRAHVAFNLRRGGRIPMITFEEFAKDRLVAV